MSKTYDQYFAQTPAAPLQGAETLCVNQQGATVGITAFMLSMLSGDIPYIADPFATPVTGKFFIVGMLDDQNANEQAADDSNLYESVFNGHGGKLAYSVDGSNWLFIDPPNQVWLQLSPYVYGKYNGVNGLWTVKRMASWEELQAGGGGGSSLMNIAISPASAELTGAATEPLLSTVSNVNNFSQLAFSDSTNQTARFFIPAAALRNYQGGAVTVRIGWKTAAASGNVLWSIAMAGSALNYVFEQSYKTARDLLSGAAGGGSERFGFATFTFAPSNGEVIADACLHLQVTRKATDGTDNLVGDAKIVELGIWEEA